MQLSRDAIQRMIGGTSGTSTGSGGGGGGVSTQWVGQNYVAISYWDEIFVVHGTQTVTVTDGTTGTVTTTTTDVTLPPNTLPSSTTETDETTGDVTVTTIAITSIEAKYDFWSDGSVSALGMSGSGGGGASLGDLLTAMNSLAVPTSAGTYVLNVTSGGVVTLVSESGGGGTTSGITLAQMWASLTNSSSDDYASTKINAAHIPYLSSLYYDSSTTLANKLSNYLLTADGVKFTDYTSYVRPEFANDSLAAHAASGWIEWWKSGSGWMNHAMGHIILNDSANGQIWADTSGTVKFNLPSSSGTLALTSQIPSLTGYATQSWVQNQNYLTSETYTGTVTSVTLSTSSTGLSITNPTVTSSGTININLATGYAIPTSDQITSWNTVKNGTWWGQSMSDGVVDNDIVMSTGDIWMKDTNPVIRMGGSSPTNILDYNSNNSTLVLGYGIRSTGYTKIEGGTVYLMASGGGTACARTGTATVNNSTGYGLWCENFMGVLNKFMFYYDDGSNTVWVSKPNGDAVNFSSKGGVSALGLTGGSSSTTVGTLNVGTLTVTSSLSTNGAINTNNHNITIGTGTLSGKVSTSSLTVGGAEITSITFSGNYMNIVAGGTQYQFQKV